MANEKDIAEKLLFDKNDVFADIINVLIFGGEKIVDEDSLTVAPALSSLKIDGKLREQERDVAKYWNKYGVRIAIYGLENQTAPNSDMPLRVIGYDGASYKAQANQHIDASKNGNTEKPFPTYPVITLVLHFGDKPWNKPKTLFECFDREIHPALKPFVNDYRINVFDIAYLERDVIEKFTSDFKVVADFFRCKRTNERYDPPAETLKHVDEVMKLLSALTSDSRFTELNIETLSQKGAVSMCDIIDEFMRKGWIEGEKAGAERLGKLVDILLTNNRFSDISKVTKDSAYRDTLYCEYNI